VQQVAPAAVLAHLSARDLGVFTGRAAVTAGVTRKQIAHLAATGLIERLHPDVFRLTAATPSHAQRLRAGLLWTGPRAAATGTSAAVAYRLADVRPGLPEIAVPRDVRARTDRLIVRHASDVAAMGVRRIGGIPVTGPEYTLLWLAHSLDAAGAEAAFEDARRRRLVTIPSMQRYLDRFGRRGRPGLATMRALLDALDPDHPARSRLEILTRRVLVAHGLTDFVRELPLTWNGRTYRYDFAFPARRTILETNGRRWHDDASDYERDQEKWSVPGRFGYRLVFATWDKVTRAPGSLIRELAATLAA